MSQTTAPSPGPDADRYSDTLALNDIYAVLTSPSLNGANGETLQAVADILVRSGRNPHPSRIITATVEEGKHGIHVAWVDSEGTIVTVGQDPGGPGIRIDVKPRDPIDEAALVVAIDGKVIRRAQPGDLS